MATEKQMNDLIQWYFDNWYQITLLALNGFRDVYDCAYAHYYKTYPKGEERYICDQHQQRVGNKNLEAFAKVIHANKDKLKDVDDFEGLYSMIKNYNRSFNVEEIECIGELAKYDCAARISWLDEYNHLRPEALVYIHAGVYKGATLLFKHGCIVQKPRNNSTLPITAFDDKLFSKLFEKATCKMSKSMIMESFLCNITKDGSPIHNW